MGQCTVRCPTDTAPGPFCRLAGPTAIAASWRALWAEGDPLIISSQAGWLCLSHSKSRAVLREPGMVASPKRHALPQRSQTETGLLLPTGMLPSPYGLACPLEETTGLRSKKRQRNAPVAVGPKPGTKIKRGGLY